MSQEQQDTGDCVMCKVLQEGICKEEFEAFDKCYDDAQAKRLPDEVCMPKFDAFRECMSRKMRVSSIMQSAMQGR